MKYDPDTKIFLKRLVFTKKNMQKVCKIDKYDKIRKRKNIYLVQNAFSLELN